MGIKNYTWKIYNSIQKSALIRPKFRLNSLRILGTQVDKTATIAENVFIGSNKLVMGKETAINVGSFIDGSDNVILGDYVRCGPYVRILTGTHDYRNSVIRRRIEDGNKTIPVVIERGCWIGMGSIILPGVTIAEGCIVAAGSVVTRNTEPNGLYAGNPAIRKKDLSTKDDE